jgi:hypothetical protein
VDWLLEPSRKRVLELGAGTGKLTRSLVARGTPSSRRTPRRRCSPSSPARLPVRTTVAGAEHLPFAAQSFDAVVVAQAFHWFDPLRPSRRSPGFFAREGRLPSCGTCETALSVGTPAHGAAAELGERRDGRMYGSSDEPASMSVVEASPLFGEVESTRHRFWQQLDLAGCSASSSRARALRCWVATSVGS